MDATKENTDMESRDTVGGNSRDMVPMFRYDGADETTADKGVAICREDSDRGQYSSLRQSAVMAFHSVGSFFGVDSQNDIEFWKDKLARRIRSGEMGVTLKNSLPNLKTRTSSELSGLEKKMSLLILSIDDKLTWEDIPSEDEEVNNDEKIKTPSIDKDEEVTVDETARVQCEEIDETARVQCEEILVTGGVKYEELDEMTDVQSEKIDEMTIVQCEKIDETASVQCEVDIDKTAGVQYEEITIELVDQKKLINSVEELQSKEDDEIAELELVSKCASVVDGIEKKTRSETALSIVRSESKSRAKQPLTFKYSSKSALFAADLQTKRSLEKIYQDKKTRGSMSCSVMTQLKNDSKAKCRPLSYHGIENASTASLVSLMSIDSGGRRSVARLPISSQITAKILNQSEESIIPSVKKTDSVTSFSKYGQRSVESNKVAAKDSFVWTQNPFYEDGDNDITDYLYMAEALQYYKHFIQIEKVNTKEQRKKKRRQIKDELMQQKQELQDVMNEAKEKYSIFPGSAKGNICTGHKEDDTKQSCGGTGDKGQDRDYTKQAYVRSQLEALPEFTPVFIYTITIMQIVLFCILCALGGLAPIQLQPSTTYMENIKTFVGTETVESKTLPNLWIGPSARYWIGVGALFTPCMRSDHKILTYYASLSYDMSDKLGCCEVTSRNTAGTTTQEECQHQTQGAGVWKSKKCNEREAGENSVAHILKPCCIGLTGQCVLVTHEHCTFHQGFYHTDEDHCNQVNCLQDVCNFGGFNIKSSSEKPYQPEEPNQWWRLLIPLFYYNGIFHLFPCIIVQWLLGRPIEIMAGWIRTSLIYFLSGIGGNLMSGILSPYSPQVGPSGALCGLLAIHIVEYFQSYQLIKRPCLEFLKLLLVTILFFMSGTLPYVDNFAHLGGFIIGILAAIVFLPYIVFGKWDANRKRCLLAVCFPILIAVLILLFFVFFVVQTVELCTYCKYFNCLPYTSSMCNDTWYYDQLRLHSVGQ